MLRLFLLSFLLLGSVAVRAELTASADDGFAVYQSVDISVPRSQVYNTFTEHLGSWWNAEHTFSGDAENMFLDLEGQHCLCEYLENGGSLEHMRVTLNNPQQMLRLTGGLGPLGLLGVAANMTIEFEDSDTGTRVVLRYVVGGYDPEGLQRLAEPVDFVLGDVLQRLKTYAEQKE